MPLIHIKARYFFLSFIIIIFMMLDARKALENANNILPIRCSVRPDSSTPAIVNVHITAMLIHIYFIV